MNARRKTDPGTHHFSPAPQLARYVACYRIGAFCGPSGHTVSTVLPPDTGTELVISAGVRIDDHLLDKKRESQAAAYLIGPLQAERPMKMNILRTGSRVASVVFKPGAGPLLFRFPGRELLDEIVDARPLLSSDVTEALDALDRIAHADSHEAAKDEIDRFLLQVVLSLHTQLGPQGATAEWLRSVSHGARLSDLIAEASLSGRQVQRRFRDAFGMSPSRIRRLMRFRKTAGTIVARPQLRLATIAATMGYSDQAHMARDFRSFAGVSPSEYSEKRASVLYLGGPVG